ncbi:39S ribosomal protein L46, mitochondrial-like [Salvia splendens]|uniref:39S ribosomal protein L46, mitochondrial-like n=1 Tax=Salvia splendens TaxID=180675 RepID=UPI001C2540B9|nr:39S ribosomal protein L46, mitochondrial-like [Salvia splendens]XP_042006186.1 39S ribosomal protein L46, mitochondrial-like [Salvia splendens]XP_042006187.1 39S ribosomal protein L46, mitochondrial-like [Salvia splendens]
MQPTVAHSRLLARPLLKAARAFSTSPSKSGGEKIIASVLFERLPVVIPKIDPVVYAFHEFSFRWQQQYRKEYPGSFLQKSNARGQGDHHIEYTPAPRITEADKTNDKKSLQRALDRRLYLLLYGSSFDSNGTPVWHFPEKVYDSEPTLRKCAESALESVVGDLSKTYFVGNAPMGHTVVQPAENDKVDAPSKRFFFKSQLIATSKINVEKCEDYLWVTKDELLEYFPQHAEYLNKMIIS